MKQPLALMIRHSSALAACLFVFSGAAAAIAPATSADGVAGPTELRPVIVGKQTVAGKKVLAELLSSAVTLNLKNTPALHIFNILAKRGGLKVAISHSEPALLTQRMNFTVTHVGFWAAMQEFLGQSGLVLDQRWVNHKMVLKLCAASVAQNAMTLSGTQADAGLVPFYCTGAQFAGSVKFNRPKPRRSAALQLSIDMLLPPLMKNFNMGHLRVHEALDAGGRSLLLPGDSRTTIYSNWEKWRQELQLAIKFPQTRPPVVKLLTGNLNLTVLQNHRRIAFSPGTLETPHILRLLGCNVEFFPLMWDAAKKRYTQHFSVTPVGFNRLNMTQAQKNTTNNDEQIIFSRAVPIVYDAENHPYFSDYESDCGCHSTGLGKMVYTTKPAANNGFKPPPMDFPGVAGMPVAAKAIKAPPKPVIHFGPPVRLTWLAPSSQTVIRIPFEFHNLHLYPQ